MPDRDRPLWNTAARRVLCLQHPELARTELHLARATGTEGRCSPEYKRDPNRSPGCRYTTETRSRLSRTAHVKGLIFKAPTEFRSFAVSVRASPSARLFAERGWHPS